MLVSIPTHITILLPHIEFSKKVGNNCLYLLKHKEICIKNKNHITICTLNLFKKNGANIVIIILICLILIRANRLG